MKGEMYSVSLRRLVQARLRLPQTLVHRSAGSSNSQTQASQSQRSKRPVNTMIATTATLIRPNRFVSSAGFQHPCSLYFRFSTFCVFRAHGTWCCAQFCSCPVWPADLLLSMHTSFAKPLSPSLGFFAVNSGPVCFSHACQTLRYCARKTLYACVSSMHNFCDSWIFRIQYFFCTFAAALPFCTAT